MQEKKEITESRAEKETPSEATRQLTREEMMEGELNELKAEQQKEQIKTRLKERGEMNYQILTILSEISESLAQINKKLEKK